MSLHITVLEYTRYSQYFTCYRKDRSPLRSQLASPQTINAMVNMNSLFQQVAQKTGVSNTLENEFKGRASELQRMEGDLQSKMQRLQSMKAGSDRTKLEKDVMAQRQTFSQKAQSFEQDQFCPALALAKCQTARAFGHTRPRRFPALQDLSYQIDQTYPLQDDEHPGGEGNRHDDGVYQVVLAAAEGAFNIFTPRAHGHNQIDNHHGQRNGDGAVAQEAQVFR